MNFSSSECGRKATDSTERKAVKSDFCNSVEEIETESSWDGSNMSSYSDIGLPHKTATMIDVESKTGPTTPLVKPPHSFSMLIFLAIELSSSKALPVRDIYIWITKNFPYYCFAPVGWKNSVRHNLKHG